MLVTGIALFCPEPTKCYYSTPFWLKMMCLRAGDRFAFTVRRKVTLADETRVRPIWLTSWSRSSRWHCGSASAPAGGGSGSPARVTDSDRQNLQSIAEIADSEIRSSANLGDALRTSLQSAIRSSSSVLQSAAAAALWRLGRIRAVGRRAGAGRSEEQLPAVRIGDVAAVRAEQRMVARLVAVDRPARCRPSANRA